MKLINDLFEVVSTKQCDDSYQCQVKFNPEHRIYKAHFPGNPVTPGVCLMQMGEEMLEEKYGKLLQLSVVKTIRFKKIVGPHDIPVYTFTKEVLDQDMLSVDITVSDETGESVKMSLQYKVLDA
jgi:3-hydroxyacyl-[acyl-carrier-protein] dehydratase